MEDSEASRSKLSESILVSHPTSPGSRENVPLGWPFTLIWARPSSFKQTLPNLPHSLPNWRLSHSFWRLVYSSLMVKSYLPNLEKNAWKWKGLSKKANPSKFAPLPSKLKAFTFILKALLFIINGQVLPSKFGEEGLKVKGPFKDGSFSSLWRVKQSFFKTNHLEGSSFEALSMLSFKNQLKAFFEQVNSAWILCQFTQSTGLPRGFNSFEQFEQSRPFSNGPLDLFTCSVQRRLEQVKQARQPSQRIWPCRSIDSTLPLIILNGKVK